MSARITPVAVLAALALGTVAACEAFSSTDDGAAAVADGADASSGTGSATGSTSGSSTTPPGADGAPPVTNDATTGTDAPTGDTSIAEDSAVGSDAAGDAVVPDGGDGTVSEAGGDAMTDAGGDAGSDAATDAGGDAGLDATTDAARCNPTASFGTPEFVSDLSTTGDETSVTFSPDELEVYVARNPTITAGASDIYYGKRTSRGDAFGALSPLVPPSLAAQSEDLASVSADGKVLFFAARESADASDANSDVFFSQSSNGVFGGALALADVDKNGSSETAPFFGHDGLHFYYRYSKVNGSYPRIYVTKLDATFRVVGTPAPIAGISAPNTTVQSDSHPVVSNDGTVLYFGRDAAGTGDFNVYAAKAVTPWANFNNEASVPGINVSGKVDLPAWVSDDGCLLYMISNRNPPGSVVNGGAHDIWVAQRGM